jgi:hypothetical protein
MVGGAAAAVAAAVAAAALRSRYRKPSHFLKVVVHPILLDVISFFNLFRCTLEVLKHRGRKNHWLLDLISSNVIKLGLSKLEEFVDRH